MNLTRREAIQRILAASAALGVIDGLVIAAGESRIGFDPDLLKKEIPWPRLLTTAEKRTALELANLILPEDEFGPAAGDVGVVDFIDEWVSAPYPAQVREREVIRGGLAWIEKASIARTKKSFPDCGADARTALLEAIVTPGTTEHREGHRFFRLFRDRCAAGYFTTREGWKAIGYTGNVAIGGDYPGPPEEALKHAGLL